MCSLGALSLASKRNQLFRVGLPESLCHEVDFALWTPWHCCFCSLISATPRSIRGLRAEDDVFKTSGPQWPHLNCHGLPRRACEAAAAGCRDGACPRVTPKEQDAKNKGPLAVSERGGYRGTTLSEFFTAKPCLPERVLQCRPTEQVDQPPTRV